MLDAIYLPVRPAGPKDGVLVARGFSVDGQRVLLDVCLGQRERVEDWLDLGQSLIRRGLRSLLLVVSDGATGLIRAITELCPDADRQAAPFIASGTSWPSCRSGQGSMSASGPPTGPRSMGQRRQLRPRPAFGSSSASSAASTRRSPPAWPTDVVAPTVHLAYPLRLRRRLRSTNLLERSLEEVRRRTKVIGRFPGETSCLTLARAVMDLVIAGDRSLGLTSPSATRSPPLVAARSVPQMEEQIAFDWWGTSRWLRVLPRCRDAALVGARVERTASTDSWAVAGSFPWPLTLNDSVGRRGDRLGRP
jgi:putative transposase